MSPSAFLTPMGRDIGLSMIKSCIAPKGQAPPQNTLPANKANNKGSIKKASAVKEMV